MKFLAFQEMQATIRALVEKQASFMARQTEARPDWLEAQQELVRLRSRMVALEKQGAEHEQQELGTALRCHVDRWADIWAKQAAALFAQCADASSYLQAVLAESLESDDQRIIGLIHEALTILGSEEGERYMITIAELYEALERDYRINGRKDLKNPKARWENHLKSAFAQTPAQTLTHDAVILYVAARQKEGAANATINREMALLKRCYSLAIQAGKLTRRPYIPRLREHNVRTGFVKDVQYEALARETEKVGLWLRAMFEVAYVYGWRKSELLNLRVRQVNLEERTIMLDPGQTKNDEGRQVNMTEKVFDLLQQCIACKEPEDYVFTRVPRPGGYVYREPGSRFWWIRCFRGKQDIRRSTRTEDKEMAQAVLRLVIRERSTTVWGIPRRVTDFRENWREVTKAAGCPRLRFHDLRRTGIRNLRRSGVSEKISMRISGHLTRSVFDRYDIVDDADLKDAIRKLESSVAQRFPLNRLNPQQALFHEQTGERKPPEPLKEEAADFPAQAAERKPPEAGTDAAAILARTIVTDISDVKGALEKPRLPTMRGRNPAVEQRRRERLGRVQELVNEGKSWEQIQALMNASTGKDLSEDAYRKLIQRAERKPPEVAEEAAAALAGKI
jgi:integrase